MKRLALISLALGGLVLAAGFLIAGIRAPTSTDAPVQMTAATEQQGLQTVTLRVDNMTCAACPMIVRRTLEGVDGVSATAVSYRDKTAVVTFDPAKCSAERLTAATARMGYPSTVIR